MDELTQIEIKIPCEDITTNDIPRILLNLRTWLEVDCPEPIINHITHHLDTGMLIIQQWPIVESSISQGGPDMFKVCPPYIKLNVSRWQRSIKQIEHINVHNFANATPSLTIAKIHQKQSIMAHNITTRRQYSVADSGGGFIGIDSNGYHKQRYVSWRFNELDNNKVCGGIHGCYIEIREYLPPNGVDRRVSLINNKRVFNIILFVPVNSKKDADEKIAMFNKTEQLQLLLHRLCYICQPLST